MPVVFICSNCGHVLYVFNRAGQDYYGIPTPSELSSRIGGVCPYCGKTIVLKPSLSNIGIRIRGGGIDIKNEVSVGEVLNPLPK